MNELGNLVQIRREKKVSQKGLADALNITATTLSRYEKERRQIPFDIVIKYAEHLGYKVGFIKM